jgi:hypothetical protein
VLVTIGEPTLEDKITALRFILRQLEIEAETANGQMLLAAKDGREDDEGAYRETKFFARRLATGLDQWAAKRGWWKK